MRLGGCFDDINRHLETFFMTAGEFKVLKFIFLNFVKGTVQRKTNMGQK
jgi:hypothetical protein